MCSRYFLRGFSLFSVIFVHCLLLGNGVNRCFPNVDEVAHLPAGIFTLCFGRFDSYVVNPPLVRTVAGVAGIGSRDAYEWGLHSSEVGGRPEFGIGANLLRREKLAHQRRFILPRLACWLLLLIGAATLALVIYRSVGVCSAILVAAYMLLCPNLLANVSSIVPDVGALSLGVVASVACQRYVSQPCFDKALIGGLCFGFALLTKLTWVLGFIVFPLTAGLCVLTLVRSVPNRSIRLRLADLCVFTSASLVTLNSGYLFESSFMPVGTYEFCSELLGGKGSNSSVHGNRFGQTWVRHLPVPFPRSYVLGVDFLRLEVERKYWSFLQGEWRFGSWPHYYVMTTLYKTPEPTLLGALIGLGVLIAGIRKKMVEPKVVSMFLFLIIPAAVCFASVSLQGGFNHHHRYVLMIYPPMFALAAYIASPVGVELLKLRLPFLGPQKRSIAVPLAITLAVLSAASSLRVHPFYTSYFNTISGGPENGWRLLGFSNIDWGQDILEVDKWLKAHPERRPLVMDIDYFGMNGDLFDVPTTLPPQLPKGASIDEVRRSVTETQWWIISVKKLYNHPGHNGVEYLQQIAPVERIAYAYHVYRIDPLPKEE
jgi:hypothetical protein